MRPRREGDSELRAVAILAVLERHQVRYIMVGSYSAITQGIDLNLTDLDIVPALDEENRVRLIGALKDLQAREQRGDHSEVAYELIDDPSLIADTTFWTFVTPYGDLDIVLRPAGFPRGYEDLIGNAHVVSLSDYDDPFLTVEALVADLRDVYESKRRAARRKDIEALPRFIGIHSLDAKEALRARYQAEQRQRTLNSPTTEDSSVYPPTPPKGRSS